MDYLELKKEIEKLNLKIFTINDLVKISNDSKNTLLQFIKYQKSKNNIFSLKKGYYIFEKDINKFLLSTSFNNTYVSLNSALEFYGITTQRYNNLELISKNRLKNTNVLNTNINFILSKHFFGYYKIEFDNIYIFIADKEKLLIDCLLNLDKVYLSEIYLLIKQTKFDLTKLKSYLNKINSAVLNKRLGYLMELNNINLDLKINNKYDLLNPLLKNNNIKNNKWKLIINEVIENE